MANHKSAEKRIRQTQKREERNRYYRTRIKNIARNVREAVASNDVAKASEAFKIANKEIHSFVSKGILKKNTAARKVSRLNSLVKKLAKA
ncbi:30S ribosomal protein S20 [Helicobacter saguini]|uniref:Small ribosomal subunit protein bS20 n=1 Tax=Helicobacter saguini TaxID=1548018 RepID=A0A347VTK9_9HELI|nr:30S ribosomal protein S20 [Helicobacter saguini]MWV62052.1 30S ribosomal protein S20 [Helicobacter saguini]MWV67274.1 30S ribosomal protein S20 [Helicobacter saguini]MWV69627.1 30S ribosomal protein S20 [Helicobacter saguini]MWV70822.1 30S ribosomal protein S20 [Helicobacter saguini]TLD94337.1 30S ribosomal protein S20 [Helicobacter saguini]